MGLTLKQIRQRLGFQKSQLENVKEVADAALAHTAILTAEMDARVAADEAAPPPVDEEPTPPDEEPEPPVEDEPPPDEEEPAPPADAAFVGTWNIQATKPDGSRWPERDAVLVFTAGPLAGTIQFVGRTDIYPLTLSWDGAVLSWPGDVGEVATAQFSGDGNSIVGGVTGANPYGFSGVRAGTEAPVEPTPVDPTPSNPVPVPTGGAGAHQPAGMTPFAFSDFASLPSGAPWFFVGTPVVATVDGRTVFRQLYRNGMLGGQSPNRFGITFAGLGTHPRTIYHRYRFRYSPGFTFHTNSAFTKQHFHKDNEQGGGGDPLFFSVANGEGGSIAAQTQGSVEGFVNRYQNVGAVPIRAGSWYEVEIVSVMNDEGKANGEVHVWVNGVKTLQHTNIAFSTGDRRWNSVDHDAVWGGKGGTLTKEQFLDTDLVYVSQSPNRVSV